MEGTTRMIDSYDTYSARQKILNYFEKRLKIAKKEEFNKDMLKLIYRSYGYVFTILSKCLGEIPYIIMNSSIFKNMLIVNPVKSGSYTISMLKLRTIIGFAGDGINVRIPLSQLEFTYELNNSFHKDINTGRDFLISINVTLSKLHKKTFTSINFNILSILDPTDTRYKMLKNFLKRKGLSIREYFNAVQ